MEADNPCEIWNHRGEIYAVTSPLSESRRSLENQVSRFLELGIFVIQIREKIQPPSLWQEDARNAIRLAHMKNAIIIMNDYLDLALTLQCDGIHLGQEDQDPTRAKKLNPDWCVGRSCGSALQVDCASADENVDYLGIGPIYPTPLKPAEKPVGLSLLQYASGKGKPIVAIGGITPGRVQDVLDAGATMAAMIRGVWDL